MAPLPPFDREMLIFFFPLGMLLVPEEMSGICHALPPAGKEAVERFVIRMAEPPPPRSALVVEIVLVIGLFDPNEVSISGEDLSPFSPSMGLLVKTGIFDVDPGAGFSA